MMNYITHSRAGQYSHVAYGGRSLGIVRGDKGERGR